MRREILEELGLSREIIDRIMAEHGKSIEALKLRCSELEAEGAKNAELTSTLESEKNEFSKFRHKVIEELVEEARPSSRLAKSELIKRLEENRSGELRRIISDIRTEDPSAFAEQSCTRPIFSAPTCSEPDTTLPIHFNRVR